VLIIQLQNRNLIKLLLIALTVKFCIPFLALLFQWYTGGFTGLSDELLQTDPLLESYSRADAGWYRVIALYGYSGIPEHEMAGWGNDKLHFAFFPLFPACISALMHILGLTFHSAAFVFSLCTIASLVIVSYHFLLSLKLPEDRAFRIVALMLFFPFSLHFYFVYTESLFLTLLLSSFLLIHKKRWIWLMLCAGLLVLTRPNGLFMILPLWLYQFEQSGKSGVNGLCSALRTASFYALLIMPLVFLVWMVFQYCISGDYFAFATAQSGWNKHAMFPLLALFRNGFWQEQLTSVYCILVMLLAIWNIRVWPGSFSLLFWIGMLLPLSAGSVISMNRYIAVLFPIYIQDKIADFTARNFKRICLLLMLLQLICLKLWLDGNSLMY